MRSASRVPPYSSRAQWKRHCRRHASASARAGQARPLAAVRRFVRTLGADHRPGGAAGLLRHPRPHPRLPGRRRRRARGHPPRPLAARLQPRPGSLQRRDLGADRDRLHARLRDHRADQLRPRRRVHDRLVHGRRRSGARSACGLATGTVGLIVGLLLTLIVAMVVCGSLNVLIERVAYRPLRSAPKLAPLITAVGFSFILQNVGLLWLGGSPQRRRRPDPPGPDGRSASPACRSSAATCWRCVVMIPLVIGAGLVHQPTRARARRCAPPRRTPRPRG